MACSCKGKRKQFELVSPEGKVLSTYNSEAAARIASRRPANKGSTVRPMAQPKTTTAKKQSTTKKTVNRA